MQANLNRTCKVEIRENALIYEPAILHEDNLSLGSPYLSGTEYLVTIDLSDGFDFYLIGFRSRGNRAGVRVDNVSLVGNPNEGGSCELLGDLNGDGVVNLLDVGPFVDAVSNGNYVPAADINGDGAVNLLDVGPFVDLLNG